MSTTTKLSSKSTNKNKRNSCKKSKESTTTSGNDEEPKTRTKKVQAQHKTRKTTLEAQEKDDDDLVFDYDFNKLNQRHNKSKTRDKNQSELDALFEEVHHASKELSKNTIDHKLFSSIVEDDEGDIVTLDNGNNNNGQKRQALQDKTNWAQNKIHKVSSSTISSNQCEFDSASEKTTTKAITKPSSSTVNSNINKNIKYKEKTKKTDFDLPSYLDIDNDKNGKNPITAENDSTNNKNTRNDSDSSDDPLTNVNEPPQAVRRVKIWMREVVPLPITISDDEFLSL
ncbi:4015_t:CDS:2 [Ambispora gerdemannii]|uniref:4015_t:CDS:1 n=1 Tax=Ambispora gerdemannii TaxID=144530 RepID=A0A9N9A7U4_9GLOM|nr:4015_t:CDS:2 [Ambispora gerdemannii]